VHPAELVVGPKAISVNSTLGAREWRLIAWWAMGVTGLCILGWWEAANGANELRASLHTICEAARRQNETLLGHDNMPPFPIDLKDVGKIDRALRPIFDAGCGGPIPTD
jgi:hypothetical protein